MPRASGATWLTSKAAIPKSVRPQHVIAGEFLARPQGKSGSIVDGIDRNHHARIRERYPAWRPCTRRRVDDGIIEQSFGILRSEVVFSPAPMQSHVKR